MNAPRLLALVAAPLLLTALSGCIVGSVVETAADVVTLPVKAGAKAVDLATTSDEEKDAKFVRRMREACEDWEKARKRNPDLQPPNDQCER